MLLLVSVLGSPPGTDSCCGLIGAVGTEQMWWWVGAQKSGNEVAMPPTCHLGERHLELVRGAEGYLRQGSVPGGPSDQSPPFLESLTPNLIKSACCLFLKFI